jgi:hypothetical protein
LPLLAACLGWDRNCQGVFQVLEAVAREMEGRLRIGIVQHGFVTEFMECYGVEGTPTFVLFYRDREIDRIRGVFSEREILEFVNRNLGEEGNRQMVSKQRVIAYLGRSSPETRRLCETIREAAGSAKVVLCKRVKTLDDALRLCSPLDTVVVLLARGGRSLLKLFALRERLDRLPLIVILGHAGRKTVSIAHLLHPRYLTLISQGFEDVGMVLGRILDRSEKLARTITHGLEDEPQKRVEM